MITWSRTRVLDDSSWSLFSYRRRSNSRVENVVATLIASHRAMRLDPVEYNLVLTLVLCRPGKSRSRFRPYGGRVVRPTAEQCVCLCLCSQDLCGPEYRDRLTAIGANARDALMKHAAFKSPTRYYGILTCILSVTDDLARYLKIVFFEPSVRNVPMDHLVSVIDWIASIGFSNRFYTILLHKRSNVCTNTTRITLLIHSRSVYFIDFTTSPTSYTLHCPCT